MITPTELEQSRSTLQFATGAKKITQKAKINQASNPTTLNWNIYACKRQLKWHTTLSIEHSTRENKKRKYHCTVGLLFDWFGLDCFAKKNSQLSYSWYQTSQTGGQRYNDTSPIIPPWFNIIPLNIMSLNMTFSNKYNPRLRQKLIRLRVVSIG